MTSPDLLEGRAAWVFEDHFDIDRIIGVENIKIYDPVELLPLTMTAFDPGFVDAVRPGDLLVGGRNFGYGHPHYPAMIAVRALGIAGVVADSFAPGFKRGETYNGMILVPCPGIAEAVQRWDDLRVFWREGRVEIPGRGVTLQGPVPSDYQQRVLDTGGVYNLLKQEYAPEPGAV